MLKIFRRMAVYTHLKVRETITMMKLTISAAALIAAAAFVTVPASADLIGGGPRVQNGKCWKDASGHDARYGTWTECPKAASIKDSTCQTMNQLAWEKAHVGFYYFDVCGANARGEHPGATPTSTTGAAKPRTPAASR
jgi:hypothetical protein